MKTELLFEACTYIDDRFLAISEKKRRKMLPFTGVAASAAAILLAVSLLLPQTPQSEFSTSSQYPKEFWNITYNKVAVTTDFIANSSLKYGYLCMYGEPLSAEEFSTFAPFLGDSNISCSGSVCYTAVGLEWVDIIVEDTTLPSVSVRLSEKEWRNHCYTQDTVISQVGGDKNISVIGYESESNDRIDLSLQFRLNEQLNVTLSASCPKEQAEATKERLSDIVSWYVTENPNLTLDSIKSKPLPIFRTEEYTLEEALADPTFGFLFLKEVPKGFVAESITRLYHPDSSCLRGLWTSDLNMLQWKVSYLNDADQKRITDVSDTKNYDLALYPIPRADSVPEELREIVDNPVFDIRDLTLEVVQKRSYSIADAGDTNGKRMHFSVLYGDILVEVSAKGVSSEWIYEQLKAVHKIKKE